jgi:hypothetical protein
MWARFTADDLSFHHQEVDDSGGHDDADKECNGECGGWAHTRTLLC